MRIIGIWILYFFAGALAASLIEYEALWSLYNATSGDNWSWRDEALRWNFTSVPPQDPCSEGGVGWEGITCNKDPQTCITEECTVLELFIPNRGLNGTIPCGLSQLHNLTLLNLATSAITGTVPPCLFNLTALQELVLLFMPLTGTIPVEISQLSHMRSLWLSITFLSGPLNGLNAMSNLSTLILDYSDFSGSLPVLHPQAPLSDLWARRNAFSGELPIAYTSYPLRVIALTRNLLSGSLPQEIGNLTAATYIIINFNAFTGSLPKTMSQLRQVEDLYINNNYFSGTLPLELHGMVSLMIINADYNLFSGSIPDNLFIDSTRLSDFSFRTNPFITGTIPSFLYELEQLNDINLSNTHITGSISANISNLVNLYVLQLFQTGISGTIPSGIGLLSSLQYLNLFNTPIHGPLPPEMSHCMNLTQINLFQNQLTGSLPNAYGSLAALEIFNIFDNYLSSTIPTNFGEISELNVLDLYDNYISGTIPNTWAALLSIDLSYNLLHGTIPQQMSSLTKMVTFDISRNDISSTIPAFFGNMTMLSYLAMANNRMTGTIPSSFTSLTLLMVLDLSYNKLEGTLPNGLTYLCIVLLQKNLFNGKLHNVFTSESQFLMIVDISDNAFSGSLPEHLFTSPILRSVAATSNCFTGTLPSTLCDAATAVILALDGLSSGNKCPQKNALFPALARETMQGSIPKCIWHLSNLTSLHISGNGFSGQLSDIIISNATMNISVSYNRLTGRIPPELQGVTATELDLSHNKISGTVDDLNNDARNTSSVTLAVNRLSGDIHRHMKNYRKVDVLAGNLFHCNGRSDLPPDDPSVETYVCGSDDMDKSLFAACAVVAGVAATVLFLCYVVKQFISTPIVNVLYLLTELDKEALTPQLRLFISATLFLAKSIVALSATIIIVCVVLYPLLKSDITGYNYTTHSYQYRWYISAAFLSGVVPAVIIFFFWGVVFLLTVLIMIRLQDTIRRDNTLPSLTVHAPPHRMLRLVLVVTGNIAVASCMNAAYTYALVSGVFYGAVVWLQFGLAICRALWNRFIFVMISLNFTSQSGASTTLRTSILLLNSIIMPTIVAALTDDSCFVGIFREPDELTTYYTMPRCSWYEFKFRGGDRIICTEFDNEYIKTTFVPPFQYNFQCSSAILKHFIPVFMFTYTMYFTLLFVLWCILIHARGSWVPQQLYPFFPPILWMNSSNQAQYRNRNVLCMSSVFSWIFGHIAVIVVFGIASPFVAFMCTLSLLMYLLVLATAIKKYIERFNDTDNAMTARSDLESAFSGLSKLSLKSIWTMIYFTSAFMIGFLLVDIAGDTGRAAWRVSFIFLGVCVAIASCVRVYMNNSSIFAVRSRNTVLGDIEIEIKDRQSNPIVNITSNGF